MSQTVAYFRDETVSEHDIAYQLYLQDENQKNRGTAVLLFLLGKEIFARTGFDGVQVPDSTVEETLKQIQGEGNLEGLLNNLGYTIDELKEAIRTQKSLDLWLETEHTINEDDFEKFFQERFANLEIPPKYHLRHILLMFDPEKKGADHGEIQNTMDEVEAKKRPFEEKAMLYSECVSATNGGDLGWVHAKDLYPEIGEQIQKMAPGDAPVRVQTEIGLHLLEVMGIEEGKVYTDDEKRKIARERYVQLQNKTELKYIIEKIRSEIRFEP